MTIRNRVKATIGAVALLCASLVVDGVSTTEAAWVDHEHSNATFTSGVLGTPQAQACSRSGTTFTPSWSPPAPPSVDAKYQHRLIVTVLGIESVIYDWTTPPTVDTSFSYDASALLAIRTYHFSVRAVAGSWISSAISGTARVTILGGAVSSCSWSA